MGLYKAEGVVIRTRNLGEADRIVTLYTRERGKVEAVARGSRRTRSRLLGSTQLFTHGRYLMFSGRSLDTVSQAEIQQSFSTLREDLSAMAYASYFAELLDVAVESGETNEGIFDLIVGGLTHLQDGVDADLVSRWFDFRLMALLGYRPELDHCVGCGENGETPRFSVREGGLVCSSCFHRDSSSTPVHPSTVAFIKRFLTEQGDRLPIVKPSRHDLRALEAVSRPFVDYRLPRPLKSLRFLTSIKELA